MEIGAKNTGGGAPQPTARIVKKLEEDISPRRTNSFPEWRESL
jgi:hypothetical protein